MSIAQSMRIQEMERAIQQLQEQVKQLTQQVKELTEKRPPGRPKNAER